jgi:hypothetical protein
MEDENSLNSDELEKQLEADLANMEFNADEY